MAHQSPAGARDLLPLDVVQKRWIEDRLEQVFHQWGYHRIITSTLERLDTLMAGGAIERSTVIQLQDLEEEPLGLRPELTASIARAAVSRMSRMTSPLRLYYTANVFRRSPENYHNRQQEFYQAGVELLGKSGLIADAEVLLVLLDCLHGLPLTHCSLLLGEAGLTRSLLSDFPPALQTKVRQAIAHLDRIGLEQLPLSAELRDRALMLLDLRGNPGDVLQQVSRLDLTPSQQDALTNLKSLIDLLQETAPFPIPVILDLSLIQTFDYYTGIVFEVVTQQAGSVRVLGQGGRYDQLLGVYHPQGESQPGIGFSWQIEELHQVLLPTGQLPEPATCDWLVVPLDACACATAFRHAQHLRQTDHALQVELDLGGRTPDEVRDDARDRRIASIAWVQANAEIRVEPVHNS